MQKQSKLDLSKAKVVTNRQNEVISSTIVPLLSWLALHYDFIPSTVQQIELCSNLFWIILGIFSQIINKSIKN